MLSFSTVAVFVFMLALIGGINVYLAFRVHQCIRALVPQASVGYAIAFFLLMAVVMIVGFARSMIPMPAALRNALGVVSVYWMGIFVYLLLYVVLAEAAYLVLRCFVSGTNLREWTVLAAVVLTITTSAYGIWHANDQRQRIKVDMLNSLLLADNPAKHHEHGAEQSNNRALHLLGDNQRVSNEENDKCGCDVIRHRKKAVWKSTPAERFWQAFSALRARILHSPQTNLPKKLDFTSQRQRKCVLCMYELWLHACKRPSPSAPPPWRAHRCTPVRR